MGGRGSSSKGARGQGKGGGGGDGKGGKDAKGGGGGGGVGDKAPAGSGTEGGVIHAKADVGEMTRGNLTGPKQALKTPGYTVRTNPNGTGTRKLVMEGKDGGTVYSGSKAQANRIASHLDKYKLPTSLRNVPTSAL